MAEVGRDTIGCDLGDRHCELFIVRADGTTEIPKRLAMTPAAFKKFFSREPAKVALENGTHSRWVSALLKKLGHDVTVANTRRLALITSSDSKSDRTDSELLARLARADLSLLSPIKHRGETAQADLAVAKARDALVRCRTRLVNQVRGLVKSFGVRLPSCDTEYFHRKAPAEVPEQLKPALTPLFAALEAIHEQIRRHDETIEEISTRYPDMEGLSQIDGVGTLTSFVFLLTVEDKARFKKSRMVGAFLGLRPRRDQSGETDKQLGITKAGDEFTRRLLVNAANYILGPFGQDSDLKRWGLKLTERGGKNARQRAKIAVARKLAVLMHRLWVTGETYKPLGYRAAAA